MKSIFAYLNKVNATQLDLREEWAPLAFLQITKPIALNKTMAATDDAAYAGRGVTRRSLSIGLINCPPLAVT